MLSLRAYATHRKEKGLPGGSLEAVRKATKSGRVKTKAGKIDPVQADADWLTNSDQRRQRQRTGTNAGSDEPTPPSDGTFQEAQRQREWERLRRERTARRLRDGELVEVTQVREAWADIASRVRDGVMGLPSRVCNRLPAEWPRRVADVLDDEGRKLLSTLGSDIRAVGRSSKAAIGNGEDPMTEACRVPSGATSEGRHP